MVDKIIKNGKVVTPSGILDIDIAIEGEKIAGLGNFGKFLKAEETIDAKGKLVIPGGIDPHTHFELKFMGAIVPEKWDQASAAAAIGGTTSYIDHAFPNKGEDPMAAVERRAKRAKVASASDFAMMGAFLDFSNLEEIPGKIKELSKKGVPSFKVFTIYRPEGWYANDWDILNVLWGARDIGGVVCVHAENAFVGEEWQKRFVKEGKIEPKYHAKAKPNFVEFEAMQRVISLANFAGAYSYFVHMSIKEGVELVRNERHQGHLVFAETTHKYLTHTEDAYEGKRGRYYLVSPSLRKKEDIEGLWKGIADGSVSTIGSDHAAFSKEQKEASDEFITVPNGSPGVETRVPVMYYEGVTRRNLPITKFVDVVSTNVAKIFGLYPKKGIIAPGSDADLVIFDPDKEKSLDTENLHIGTDWNYYDGVTIKGWPILTMSRGKKIVENEQYIGKPGDGKELFREIKREHLATA